jgi:hypothetical protein
MRRILCFGSGIALFCVAGLLYVAGNQNNQPGMRAVGNNEAERVIGGGQMGASLTAPITCGTTDVGCNAAQGTALTGSSMGGPQSACYASCGGGNCTGITVTTYTISKE